MDVQIKDNSNAIHNINVDTLMDGTDTQVVKMQMGDIGTDDGYISKQNPMPTVESGFLRMIFKVFGRLSFGATSGLRTEISNTPAVTISSGTVTTMTTGNIGFGDSGKASTSMLTSQQSYGCAVRPNFTKV